MAFLLDNLCFSQSVVPGITVPVVILWLLDISNFEEGDSSDSGKKKKNTKQRSFLLKFITCQWGTINPGLEPQIQMSMNEWKKLTLEPDVTCFVFIADGPGGLFLQLCFWRLNVNFDLLWCHTGCGMTIQIFTADCFI